MVYGWPTPYFNESLQVLYRFVSFSCCCCFLFYIFIFLFFSISIARLLLFTPRACLPTFDISIEMYIHRSKPLKCFSSYVLLVLFTLLLILFIHMYNMAKRVHRKIGCHTISSVLIICLKGILETIKALFFYTDGVFYHLMCQKRNKFSRKCTWKY